MIVLKQNLAYKPPPSQRASLKGGVFCLKKLLDTEKSVLNTCMLAKVISGVTIGLDSIEEN
ncbi:MAG: hypothetical protein WED59_02315 [Candidatus Woykebacteria bacterium]